MGREGWLQDGWEFKPNGEIKPGQIGPGVFAEVKAEQPVSDLPPSPAAPPGREAGDVPTPASAQEGDPPSTPPVPGGEYDRTPISPEGNFIAEVRPAIKQRLGLFVRDKKDAVATLREYGLLPETYKDG